MTPDDSRRTSLLSRPQSLPVHRYHHPSPRPRCRIMLPLIVHHLPLPLATVHRLHHPSPLTVHHLSLSLLVHHLPLPLPPLPPPAALAPADISRRPCTGTSSRSTSTTPDSYRIIPNSLHAPTSASPRAPVSIFVLHIPPDPYTGLSPCTAFKFLQILAPACFLNPADLPSDRRHAWNQSHCHVAVPPSPVPPVVARAALLCDGLSEDTSTNATGFHCRESLHPLESSISACDRCVSIGYAP